MDALGQGQGVLAMLQMGHQQGEFVATQAGQVDLLVQGIAARHHVGGAHRLAQPVRHQLQQQVPGTMAQGVVDVLEAVQVHEQHRQLVLLAAGPLHLPVQALGEGLAVGQPRQGVEIGQAVHPVLGHLALGDVLDQAQGLLRIDVGQPGLEVVGLTVQQGQAEVQARRRTLGAGIGGGGLDAVGHLGGKTLRQGHARHDPAFVLLYRHGAAGIQHQAFRVQAQQGIRDGVEHGRVARVGLMQGLQPLIGAEQVAHPVADEPPVDGLGDEIRGARLEGALHGFQVIHARDHDDGQLAPSSARHTW